MQLDLPSALKASVESSKAEYKQLGKSGLRVSVPIFGTMSLGSSKWSEWVKDDEQALPLLKAAYDRGINSWDTAGLYSNGGAEEMIGKAIRKYDIPRHKLVIMSKCWAPVSEHEDVFILPYWGDLAKSKDYVNQFGLSRQAIFNSVEASLKRIGTDYLDLLMVHRVDPTVPIEETMEALHDLVKSGKVRYIGASSMWTYQFATMQFCAERNGWTKFICMQNLYNLLYREEEREMNKYCSETGVGIIPWAPLSAGYLTRPASDKDATVRGRTDVLKRDLDEQEKVILKRVEEIANKRGWTMSQVALTWLNKRVSSPVLGFSSVKLMEEALVTRGQNLTEAEEQYLEELYQPRAIVSHS
ncbi:alcohol dehydrogenase [Blastomyces silverae]|uniref:Alcohol dehydrogenase n=1 Tax=Blastomyces silverae TaxID=2060906 RepID=A0A0H1BMD6_9EURO|nr:alcohol dehydrogenase [Blastomyces silverae]